MSEVKITGRWHVCLTDEYGNLKAERRGKNVITTAGLEWLADHLHKAVTAASNTMMYIAIGTSDTAEAVGQTALVSELARVTGTASYSSGAIYSVIATFAAATATAGAIVEYGLFNSSAAGTMFSRDTENVINKGASDSLTVTTEITFA